MSVCQETIKWFMLSFRPYGSLPSSTHILNTHCANNNCDSCPQMTLWLIARWMILAVIQLDSLWWFTSFRHKLARQTVSVTGQSQSCTFLWSCALGCMLLRSMLLSSSGTNNALCRRKRSFWIFREDMSCASLRMVVVNYQKRAVDFPEGPVNLIKMHLSLNSYKFLTCESHRQLFWWIIVVGNFAPKPN